MQHAKERSQAAMLPIQTMAAINEDSDVEPFYLPLSLMTHTTILDTRTLVKSQAIITIMFSQVWETLKKPLLTPTDVTFLTFLKTETPCLGVANFKMRIEDEEFYTKVYLVNQAGCS